jgi:hypothetical protein
LTSLAVVILCAYPLHFVTCAGWSPAQRGRCHLEGEVCSEPNRFTHVWDSTIDSFEHWFEGSYYRVPLYVELCSSIRVQQPPYGEWVTKVRVRVRTRRVPLECEHLSESCSSSVSYVIGWRIISGSSTRFTNRTRVLVETASTTKSRVERTFQVVYSCTTLLYANRSNSEPPSGQSGLDPDRSSV